MPSIARSPRSLGVTLGLLVLFTTAPAQAWGRNGHRIVGQIAENHLSRSAARKIAQLIGPETLAEAGTWADEIRSDPAWKHADPWHYVNVDDGATYATTPPNPAGDILEALPRFEKVLRDPDAGRQAKIEALRFLVHFLGDLHQPLHVGRASDRGGNEIEVRWFGAPSNLHRVWDTELIESEQLSFTEWVRFLDRAPPEQTRAWRAGGYLDWAAESMAVRAQVYDYESVDGKPPELGYRYAWRNLPLLEQRLLQAGIRLARVLEEIF